MPADQQWREGRPKKIPRMVCVGSTVKLIRFMVSLFFVRTLSAKGEAGWFFLSSRSRCFFNCCFQWFMSFVRIFFSRQFRGSFRHIFHSLTRKFFALKSVPTYNFLLCASVWSYLGWFSGLRLRMERVLLRPERYLLCCFERSTGTWHMNQYIPFFSLIRDKCQFFLIPWVRFN